MSSWGPDRCLSFSSPSPNKVGTIAIWTISVELPPQNNYTWGFLNFPTLVLRNPRGDHPPCGRIRRGFLPTETLQFPKIRTAGYSLDAAHYTLECRCGAVALFLIQKYFRPSLGLTSRSPCFVHLNELNRVAALLFNAIPDCPHAINPCKHCTWCQAACPHREFATPWTIQTLAD